MLNVEQLKFADCISLWVQIWMAVYLFGNYGWVS